MHEHRWQRSSYSSDQGGNCLELCDLGDNGRAVRDSKDPTGPALRLSAAQWAAFTRGISQDEIG
ncbi:MAG: DUF397 domain-containing protein [Pseudonocardiaceae bacterium]